jgi:hypothetical protein
MECHLTWFSVFCLWDGTLSVTWSSSDNLGSGPWAPYPSDVIEASVLATKGKSDVQWVWEPWGHVRGWGE